ncbi:MAG: RsmG family class I SAM-dependent methyltransferase, partial [Betaproteobacteria bacterium]
MNQSLADGLRDGLGGGLAALGLALSADQQNALLAYLALLQKWNQVYNLTAVREPQAMLSHHLLDSLAVVAPLQAQMQELAPAA